MESLRFKRSYEKMKITIAGKPGSGKSTIAKLLAKKLNFSHYSVGDFMRDMAKKRDISLLELSKLSEQNASIDKELDKMQKKLNQEDNFVIDSRIGFHFIPDSKKIFLDVDLSEGAKRIFEHLRPEEKENNHIKQTIKNIKKRIISEKMRYKKYYNLDHYDPKHFNLIINTTNLTPKDVVNKILEGLK